MFLRFNMKHIVIDARIISSSTGTYVERLLTYLEQIDHDNRYTVLVLKKDLSYWKPKSGNFQIMEANYANYSIAEQISFCKLLNKLSPDLVHFCMPQQPVLYRGQHITTFHDLTLLKTYNSDKNWLIFHIKQFIGKYVFKHALKSSSLILTPSQFTKNEIISFSDTPSDKIIVTHLSADVAIDKIEKYKNPYKQFLLYVGQQSDYKNIKRLGDAHQILLKKYPDLGLILVGNKNNSLLANETYFKEKGYKNILFTGFLANPQRDWLYKNTSAYIFPSLMEGFGLPGLEAMGYGAPVISSNATCLPEVYGNAAHYFDPNNTLAISRAIDEVLSNNKLRNALIKKGYKKLKEYSWLQTAKQTHCAYLDALREQ